MEKDNAKQKLVDIRRSSTMKASRQKKDNAIRVNVKPVTPGAVESIIWIATADNARELIDVLKTALEE